MLIISDPTMISVTAAIIDKDEYIETIKNIDSIINGALKIRLFIFQIFSQIIGH